jgi:hypothetical protein
LAAKLDGRLTSDQFNHQAARPVDFVAGSIVIVMVAPFLA